VHRPHAAGAILDLGGAGREHEGRGVERSGCAAATTAHAAASGIDGRMSTAAQAASASVNARALRTASLRGPSRGA